MSNERLGVRLSILTGRRWRAYAEQPLAGSELKLRIDQDRATLLILICPRAIRTRWESYLSTMFAEPFSMKGY